MSAPIPTQRYQIGGDIYDRIANEYGFTWADRVADAAQKGGEELTAAIANMRSAAGFTKPEQDGTSTIGNLWDQLTTNPLDAPLDGANTILGNTFASLFKNKWVLIAIILVGFYMVGGFDWLKRKVATA